jgi:hypothetical protein
MLGDALCLRALVAKKIAAKTPRHQDFTKKITYVFINQIII